MPRSEVVSAGLAGPPVGAVRQDDGVGPQQMAITAEEGAQILGGNFLFALDQDRDVDGRPALQFLPGPQAGGMGRDPGLVISRAPAE